MGRQGQTQEETRRCDWLPFQAGYRIWFKQTDRGIYQRHEWRYAGGEIRTDEWLSTNVLEIPAWAGVREIAKSDETESEK